jgi:hypothetical protein
MRVHLLAIVALAVLGSSRLAAGDTDPAAPETWLLSTVKALKGNDFKTWFDAIPADDQAKAKEQWAKSQKDPESAKKFDEFMTQMLAPDAVDALVAKAEPGLGQFDPAQTSQGLMMMSGFLPMMLQQGPNGQPRKMTPELQQVVSMAQNMLSDAAQWVQTAGLNDPKKLRGAVEHLVAGAKAIGVKNSDELHQLSLEDFLGRLGPASKEIKLAIATYDLQVDKFLDSVTATSAGTGDHRTLTVGFTAFNRPYTLPLKVEQQGGKWVPAKDAIPGIEALQQMVPGMAGGDGRAGPPGQGGQGEGGGAVK